MWTNWLTSERQYSLQGRLLRIQTSSTVTSNGLVLSVEAFSNPNIAASFYTIIPGLTPQIKQLDRNHYHNIHSKCCPYYARPQLPTPCDISLSKSISLGGAKRPTEGLILGCSMEKTTSGLALIYRSQQNLVLSAHQLKYWINGCLWLWMEKTLAQTISAQAQVCQSL